MDYSYAIIDSDATSRLQLQVYLEEYEELVCAGSAHGPTEGLNTILKFGPDVVLINLNEDSVSYFQMVSELNHYMGALPLIIGYSNSKNYAYNAIKSGFFDYWILPHNEFDIRKTIFRLRKLHPKDSKQSTICLKSYNDYRYLDTKEILYLKSDNNATDFFMRNGEVISAFKTLKSFEQRLPDGFIRIHQSYILNSRYVARINYGKSMCTLRKPTDTTIPFSKKYRERVDLLKEILSKTALRAVN
ncbi:LytR/AlgR family response regulator transcription factor [Flagellimonas allohymeniacidonis]|uniref:Response regulator transcription factor n=1 Tax=Flagellimonas allohymeniacidonis TaxID=2517819 RepID=A0A4Q8QIF9_9FLAO|nr:LytTR family DNA-binding domain-containing protein [Allomuricauda hymeniacidonis]TAI49038.1 response regulator transcription factor [Allomuricauda hymeniacidonis]